MLNPPIKRLQFSYIAFQLFFSLMLWIPVYYEFQRALGLKESDIFSIQGFYYIAFLLFEIPTGFISDRIGAKKTMLLAALTLMVSNLVPVFTFHFFSTHLMLQFAVHFFLVALARSLISGAASGYLYNILTQYELTSTYEKIEGRSRAFSLWGKILLWPITSYLMEFYFPLPYLLTAFNSLLAVMAAYYLPDLITPPLKQIKKIAWRSILKREKELLSVMFLGVGLFTMVRVCQVNLFQPLLSAKEFKLSSFGLMMSLMTVFESLGAQISWRIRIFTPTYRLAIYTALTSISFVIMTLSPTFTTAGLMMFSFFAGLAFPVGRAILNEAISDSSLRATLLSVESMVCRLFCAVTVFAIGPFVQEGFIDEVFISVGLFWGFFTVGWILVLKHVRVVDIS